MKYYFVNLCMIICCLSCSTNSSDAKQENGDTSNADQDSDEVRIEIKKKKQIAEEQAKSIIFDIEDVSFKMVLVRGGIFQMGADESDFEAMEMERPQHKVTLSDYYIGETEVTQELWETVMQENPSKSFKGGDYPVENVDWNDCQNFIEQLNKIAAGSLPDGKHFCLPTESEWEYAARGGSNSKGYLYSGSNVCQEVGWYKLNSQSHTHKVKSKKCNELGLYDMSGNVSEWCYDFWGDYSTKKSVNPLGPSDGSYHVYRGGSWAMSDMAIRNTYRNVIIMFNDDYHSELVGFRLALKRND